MRDASLVIEKWHNTYLVPADLPGNEGLRARLNQLFEKELVRYCAKWLSPVVNANDPSVWLIRSLRVDLSVDANPEMESRVAHQWSGKLAARIGDVLSREPQSESVIRFPSRTAYVAQFLRDLLAGTAWTKWYYSEFESLSNLATGCALCETLLREPELAMSVITQIDVEGGLEPMLAALQARDASRLYGLFSGSRQSASNAGERLWTARILASWSEALPNPLSAAAMDARHALRLCVFASRISPGAESDADLHAAIAGLLQLRLALAAMKQRGTLDMFLLAQRQRDDESAEDLLTAAGVAAVKETVAFLERNSSAEPGWAARAAGILLTERDPGPGATQASSLEQEFFLTRLGAVFLLGKSFVDCGAEDAIAAAAQHCDKPELGRDLLRYLVAVRCLGQPRNMEAMADRAVLVFSGLEDLAQAQIEAVALEFAAVDPAKMLGAFFKLANRELGQHLLAELLPLPSSDKKILLIVDVPTREWVYAGVVDPEVEKESDALLKGLGGLRQYFGEPVRLILGPALQNLDTDPICEQLGKMVMPFEDAESLSPEYRGNKQSHSWRQVLTAAIPTEQELAYFLMPRPAMDQQWSTAFELAGAVIARAVLQHFARRLFGFEGSSPEYLYQNFLAGLSSMRISPSQIDVHMPESPLRVLLHLSGMYESPFHLPWLGEREIWLLAPPS